MKYLYRYSAKHLEKHTILEKCKPIKDECGLWRCSHGQNHCFYGFKTKKPAIVDEIKRSMARSREEWEWRRELRSKK